MGRLIEIIRCDEEQDAVYYKFGPARDVLIGAAAILRQTGEVLLTGMEEDAPLRYVQYTEFWPLRRRARSLRVKEAGSGSYSYPPFFTCKMFARGEIRVTVTEETVTDIHVRVELPGEGVAHAQIDRASGEPTFVSVDAAYVSLVRRVVDVEFATVLHKLQQHFGKGELPEETRFCS